MAQTNRFIRFVKRPGDGGPSRDLFEQGEETLAALKPGEFLLRNCLLSMDPALVSRMRPESNYADSVTPGEVMHAYGIGQVIETNHPKVKRGEVRLGMIGMQEFSIQSDPAASRVINLGLAAPEDYLSAVGIAGATAYFTLADILKPRPGETMLISAGASAVGMMAAQLAHQAGCRTVGIVSTDDKARALAAEPWYDAALSYRGKSIAALDAAIGAACPHGVDCYFDNVSGDISEAVLEHYADFARVAVIGRLGIAHLSDTRDDAGRRENNVILARRIKKQGLVLLDYQPRMMEAIVTLARARRAGTLTSRVDVMAGIDATLDAFFRMLNGENQGKQLVELAGIDHAADPAPRGMGRLLTHPRFPARPLIAAIRAKAA